ncbi:hypothetical protein AW928_13650 [Pseudomonas aeruginosa]|nr:hypothetical protein AW928_13650 [Pseudomonas aeruginosa]KXE62405.1 hypothetical protein AW929_13225 [Pseudomonas aeruginosa]KXE75418.1 hypothetical protein AW931_13240 [Pseudomonas aeruginosa]KXE76846.1 hypothetical protein AW930_13265 [Pseudomonas aeruginosa]
MHDLLRDAYQAGQARAALAQPSPAQAEQPTADDYEEVLADHRRLVREMDVLLNGEACAAKQAMLCDLVSQVEAEVRKSGQPLLVSAERYRWLRNDDNWGADDSEGQGTSKWANLGELSGTDFDAYLDQLRGSNPVMDIDPEHSKAIAKRGRDAIVAQAEGAPVIGCLCGMPMTEGRHSPGGCTSLEEFAPNPAQAQSEQAEAERPEMSPERAAYFMRRFKSEEKLLGPNEQAAVDYVLSLLAQHDRIVGALRAENAKLSEALDRWPLIRDSLKLRLADALARVAELETALEPFAAVADAYDDSEDDDHEPYTDMGCDDSLRLTLGQHRAGRIALEGRTPQAQAQHSVPDGAADLCRFLAKLYCELDGLRYSTAKLPAEQIADALIFKWPVLQGARNQLNIKRISEQPYDESKLHSAIAAMLAAAPGKEVPQAWIDVQEERRRQITAEGWTPEHDDEHADGQMAQAAGCYALHAGGIGTDWPDGRQNGSALFWPWDKDSWKPTTPRRDLVKACALALAEIERLDRAGISQSPQPGATTASS